MLPEHMGAIYSVRTHKPGKQTEPSSYPHFSYLQTFHLLACEQSSGLDSFEAFLQWICHGLVIRKGRIVCLRKSSKQQLPDVILGQYWRLLTPRCTRDQRATSSTFSSGMREGLGGCFPPKCNLVLSVPVHSMTDTGMDGLLLCCLDHCLLGTCTAVICQIAFAT